MKNEPVIIGQVASLLAIIVMFLPAVREAVEAVGGTTVFTGAITTVIGFITFLARRSVTPVNK